MSPRPVSQHLARGIAAALGWRLSVPAPPPARCVVVGAPHTSYLDLPVTLMLSFGAGLGLRWVGMEPIFRGPAGPLLRALGGIPVSRERSSNFVAQMIAAFAESDALRLSILPEGTRRNRHGWRSGFYHIAVGAGVPIVLGYADYRRREAGLGPTITPSGDIEADFRLIRDFYQGVVGRHPDRQGPIKPAGPRQ